MGFQSVPHIIPDVLYPAVAGKLLDGSTSHGATYGTAQSDGRSYYYTDIKGSKPIKDPRIGAHFGSQRHKIKSIQQLEQETATHGKGVWSIDGREWMRYVDSGTMEYGMTNDANGFRFVTASSAASVNEFFEIVGYFTDANIIASRYSTVAAGNFKWSIDGGSETLNTAIQSTVATPLGGRYVDEGSVHNIGCGATLGIHTLKIRNTNSGGTAGQVTRTFGFELIAQDTTSTTTKSQIQIPSQNVVSYGKKFTVSGTPHYNPFAFKTDGSTAWASGAHNGTAWPVGTGSSANIDTATSLGLDAWVSTNYYKPYNGGRVVWWVDSSGTLKCSVNMMPPNARNVAETALAEKGDDSAGTTSAAVANNTYLPTFTDQAIDHSQAEVAKTFNWREFGNGGANGGAASSFADASMFTTSGDNIAYVMDDGLTSFSGEDVRHNSDGLYHHDTTGIYLTFIGTGISYNGTSLGAGEKPPPAILAQNLPYGTHILKFGRYASYGTTNGNDYKLTLDGVVIADPWENSGSGVVPYLGNPEFTFHQPKMPPIPEDAVVIADYMLMADFVPVTGMSNNTSSIGRVSKGVRAISASRDAFYDGASAWTAIGTSVAESHWGLRGYLSAASAECSLTAFGHGFSFVWAANPSGSHNNMKLAVDTLDATAAYLHASSGTEPIKGATAHKNDGANLLESDGTWDSTGSSSDQLIGLKDVQLGNHKFKAYYSASDDYIRPTGFEIATPIHTSSHYQTFETPFLHELVGGDRNMEQTNLVVTPDGKTWDEVTRDTSYIGNITWSAGDPAARLTSSGGAIFTDYRGVGMTNPRDFHQKDFAIAYDRHICLRTGYYCFYMTSMTSASEQTGGDSSIRVSINGEEVHGGYLIDADHYNTTLVFEVDMKRGDYFQVWGYLRTSVWSNYQVMRVK
jgi:hypothetical protein